MNRGVGELLAFCREDAGLTQKYMAKKAKCQQAYISMVERDERESAGVIDLYARETGHPELWLLHQQLTVDSVMGIVKERIEHRKARELFHTGS